ncbi:MAG: hypothetical protein JWM05_1419 [Acidimicrobiales bacterium]|nr:hypothetical protein [Acidimicrobiales bacterium]
MASNPAFVSRLVRLPLLDIDGGPIGRVEDVLLVPSGDEPPRVLGFVASVQRRRIFVNAARVADVEPTGLRMRTGTIDLHPFRQRPGEQLARGDLFDTRVGDEFLTDIAIVQSEQQGTWVVVSAALGRRGPLRSRRTPHIVPWSHVAGAFTTSNPELAEVAELRDLHPSDVASRLRSLPLAKRQRLAELLEDDRLADLIEELPDEEAVRIIESLDIERAAHVLEEMEPDDAADLLGVLPEEERSLLLEAMQPEESQPLRRLLSYDEDSAGGLMTPEPVILPGTATVAEALATIRTREIPSELAAQVFVVRPPTSTPTGTLLGVVGFQRLLREPPATRLEQCVSDDLEPVSPELPLRDVAERLASYDLLAVPVCDAAGRLVGAVTVDDVLDQVLPHGWRRVARR